MLGEDYVSAACRARAALTGEAEENLLKIAHEEVEFYPAAYAARQEYLMAMSALPTAIGQQAPLLVSRRVALRTA